MRNVPMSRKILLLMCCALLVTAAGCNKMLANYSLGKAEENVAEAVDHQAQVYSADQYEATQGRITEARNQLNIEDFTSARATAKEAAMMSDELLERTKEARARDLKENAFFWRGKADLNDANLIDEQAYQQIQQTDEQANLELTEGNWDEAIEMYESVISNVDYLLSNLERESQAGLEEAQQLREELLAEGAADHAPEYVQEISGQIDEIRRLIETDYNYREAIVVRNQARQTKIEGITQTKQVKSFKLITEIENLLADADELGAELYAAQSFRNIIRDFENLLKRFYDSNYDTVLSEAPQLKPRVEELIIETKREAARSFMSDVETAINKLTDGKARQYLPNSVESLDALLEQAQEAFNNEQYTESKQISERALDIEEQIISDFDSLAQQQISRAQDELSKAESVFGRMQEIFDTPISGDWTGEDMALENSKQALKAELQAAVNNARLSLGVAQQKRDEAIFDEAIEISRQVAQDSGTVVQQTYRVVAHNAILEIARQLAQYEREGGRQYAPAELDKTSKMLAQTRELLDNSEFEPAVRQASDTKAQLKILVQELRRHAVERIEDARSAQASARDNRAEQLESVAFQQGGVIIERANQALDEENLKAAIEYANQAESVLIDARSGALRQWSEEFANESDEVLAKAKAAGAERYAPAELQTALDVRATLRSLYDQGSYLEAVDTGRKALDAAEDALYAKVIQAENAIATARRYGGWEMEPDRLAQAIVSAKNARETMDRGEYNLAELHSANAITVANNVAYDAKQSGFEMRMAALTDRVEQAEQLGAGYYQIQDLAKIMTEMNHLRNEFDPAGFDDSARKIELLEAQLGGVIEMTPDVIEELVRNMQDRLADLESQGARRFLPDAVIETENKIKYAQIDYRAEKFRSSYANAKDAARILDNIQMNLDERAFDAALSNKLERFDNLLDGFGVVLDMGSAMMMNLAIGYQGAARAVSLIDAASPSDLREAITDLGAEVREMTPPHSREGVTHATIEMLNIARTAAANFEKLLILDQYQPRDARDIVQTAYHQMFDARSRMQEIQANLKYPNVEIEPEGVRHVVAIKP